MAPPEVGIIRYTSSKTSGDSLRVVVVLLMADVRPRILVVDDESKVAQVLKGLLELHGYRVTTCTESPKASALLADTAFDLVLLDVRMPGLEGTELLPLIKKLKPELPVVIVSAYYDRSQASALTALGAYDVVHKPFEAQVLLGIVARALGERHSMTLSVHLQSLRLREARDQLYRKVIVAALRQARWNHAEAARLLGISRRCLFVWIKRLGLAPANS